MDSHYLNEKTSILLHFSKSDLAKMMTEIFKREIEIAFDKHESAFNKQEPKTEYLTRNETAKLLSISLVTLYHWTNKGILIKHLISSRVRYKRSEVEAALQEVPNIKHQSTQ